MDYFQIAFFAVFAFVIGRFLYGRLKYGSWTGAMLRGNIDRIFGEVRLSMGLGTSQTIKVVSLHGGPDDREEFVGLVITAKAPMAASMEPFKLSKAQAQELATYLQLAAN